MLVANCAVSVASSSCLQFARRAKLFFCDAASRAPAAAADGHLLRVLPERLRAGEPRTAATEV